MKKINKRIRLTIAVTDSNAIFLSGLASCLRKVKGVVSICSAKNTKELLSILGNVHIDVICLDIDTFHKNPKLLVETILSNYSMTKILLISSYFETHLIRMLFKSGAQGFISKNASIEELQGAVSAVYNDCYYLGKNEQQILSKHLLLHKVSETSNKLARELLYLISHGLTTKEIAECLLISSKTVEYHRSNLIKSIGVRNMTGLAVYAVQHNIYSDFSLKSKYLNWT
jgi:DNA-binding NarL/FixJ family response regulator